MVSVGLSGDSFIAPSIRGQLGVGGDFLLRGWGLLSLLSLLSGDCSTAPSIRGQLGVGGAFLLRGWGLLIGLSDSSTLVHHSLLSLLSGLLRRFSFFSDSGGLSGFLFSLFLELFPFSGFFLH